MNRNDTINKWGASFCITWQASCSDFKDYKSNRKALSLSLWSMMQKKLIILLSFVTNEINVHDFLSRATSNLVWIDKENWGSYQFILMWEGVGWKILSCIFVGVNSVLPFYFALGPSFFISLTWLILHKLTFWLFVCQVAHPAFFFTWNSCPFFNSKFHSSLP